MDTDSLAHCLIVYYFTWQIHIWLKHTVCSDKTIIIGVLDYSSSLASSCMVSTFGNRLNVPFNNIPVEFNYDFTKVA